jgi:hypothetical protein
MSYIRQKLIPIKSMLLSKNSAIRNLISYIEKYFRTAAIADFIIERAFTGL